MYLNIYFEDFLVIKTDSGNKIALCLGGEGKSRTRGKTLDEKTENALKKLQDFYQPYNKILQNINEEVPF